MGCNNFLQFLVIVDVSLQFDRAVLNVATCLPIPYLLFMHFDDQETILGRYCFVKSTQESRDIHFSARCCEQAGKENLFEVPLSIFGFSVSILSIYNRQFSSETIIMHDLWLIKIVIVICNVAITCDAHSPRVRGQCKFRRSEDLHLSGSEFSF